LRISAMVQNNFREYYQAAYDFHSYYTRFSLISTYTDIIEELHSNVFYHPFFVNACLQSLEMFLLLFCHGKSNMLSNKEMEELTKFESEAKQNEMEKTIENEEEKEDKQSKPTPSSSSKRKKKKKKKGKKNQSQSKNSSSSKKSGGAESSMGAASNENEREGEGSSSSKNQAGFLKGSIENESGTKILASNYLIQLSMISQFFFSSSSSSSDPITVDQIKASISDELGNEEEQKIQNINLFVEEDPNISESDSVLFQHSIYPTINLSNLISKSLKEGSYLPIFDTYSITTIGEEKRTICLGKSDQVDLENVNFDKIDFAQLFSLLYNSIKISSVSTLTWFQLIKILRCFEFYCSEEVKFNPKVSSDDNHETKTMIHQLLSQNSNFLVCFVDLYCMFYSIGRYSNWKEDQEGSKVS